MNPPTIVVGIRAPGVGMDPSRAAAVVEAVLRAGPKFGIYTLKLGIDVLEIEIRAGGWRSNPDMQAALTTELATVVRTAMNVENIRVTGKVL